MTAATWNKFNAPAATQNWALIPDISTALASGNVVIPVASQAERDGLAALAPGGVLPIPTYVCRTDLTDLPLYGWNGSVWTQLTGRQHAEYTGPAFATIGGTGTNFSNGTGGTVFAVDPTKTFNNDFVQPDVGGRIKILTTGVYSLFGIILPTTVPASYSLQINDITNSVVLDSIGGVGYGNKEQAVKASNCSIAANTVIEFNLVTSNAVTLGSRVKITKWH